VTVAAADPRRTGGWSTRAQLAAFALALSAPILGFVGMMGGAKPAGRSGKRDLGNASGTVRLKVSNPTWLLVSRTCRRAAHRRRNHGFLGRGRLD